MFKWNKKFRKRLEFYKYHIEFDDNLTNKTSLKLIKLCVYKCI